jgi:general secretion pathway protein K
MRARRDHRRGVVLLIVLFFALLLTSSIASLVKHALVDAMIARNREAAAQADALARGGVRLAEALLLEDRLLEEEGTALRLDSHLDPWARAADVALTTDAGASLRLRIEDAGARFNLNSLFKVDDNGRRSPRSLAEPFLVALLEKVIDEMAVSPEAHLYDARELAANLLDYVDEDDLRQRGGAEDSYYQAQTPPYRPANGPLSCPT